ncbi:MAG: GGDEF domain-containing protein [Acidimicrobiia bacterium]
MEQRNRDLDLLARTDHLTGLWNRRHVDEHLDMAVSAARRHERPLSLLLLDIDEFKSINSRFGHQIGDHALQEVAARLKSHVRTEDTVGRWGGEEFLVVLPDTDTPVALSAAERLRAAIGDEPVRCGGNDLELTVRIGVAGDEPASQDALLTGADGALARAKAAGRNRCSL